MGRVRSLERDVYRQNGTFHHHLKEKILAFNLDRGGYQYVALSLNGKAKSIKVHRLVAEAFIPKPENEPYVNHRNEIKTDNTVENLEWCTASYNANYGTRIQRCVQNHRSYKLGDNPRARAVFCVELNKKFDCAKSAQEELGIWGTSIIKVCKGKGKTAGGFHWRYANEND